MGDMRAHLAEHNELGRIDYFLDQLARAVERGEVPMASYETLAPRYLTRRGELVAIITGVHAASAAAARGIGGHAVGTPLAGEIPRGATATPRATSPLAESRPERVREPVSWTTVLLFLGAFLVIVASGIFAFAVWSSTGPGFRLAFLGTLTAAFYAAGYYARTKLDLRAGSAALTVVASAMLLFDCWIVIDGWQFEGPLPWAMALLLCSAVYWFTEVRLGDRFYGVAGAAAQVGWWWLMSAGLHLENPVRLAGIAVIALLWQLVAERARKDDVFGSLSQVLLWAAPVVSVGASLGIAADAVVVGTSTLVSAASAAIVTLSGAAAVLRSTLLDRDASRWVAGLLQVPLFIMLMQPGTSSWLGVGCLAAVTVLYTLTALRRAGAPFAIAALGMELLTATSVLDLLHATDAVGVAVLAALAVSWTAASVLLGGVSDETDAASAYADEAAGMIRTGAYVGLVVSSLLVPIVGAGVPLSGVTVPSGDVLLAVGVLVAWSLSCVIRRGPFAAFGTALWSFYSAAALCAWLVPGLTSPQYALVMLAVAGAWIGARRQVERFYRAPAEAFGWTMRAISIVLLAGGVVAEFFRPDPSIASMAALAVGFSAVFLLDAVFAGPRVSAAIAAAGGVLAAGLGGLAVRDFAGDGGLAATGAGLVLAVVGAALRDRWAHKAQWFAVAAAGAATIAAAMGPTGWPLVGSLALAAAAWCAAGFSAREQALAFPAGLLGFSSVVAGVATLDPSQWSTILALGLAAGVLGLPAALSDMGLGGRFERTGQALALAGLFGAGFLVALGVASELASEVLYELPLWAELGCQGVALCFAIAAAYVIAQSHLWKYEFASYGGWALLLVSVCVELSAWDVTAFQVYTTAIAAYLAAMGYLYASRGAERRVPVPLDIATVAVGVGFPTLIALTAPMGAEGFSDLVWAVGLALLSITAGVVLKVRSYLFGAAGALVVVVGWRSFSYLASVWWLVLGLVGTAMLVIALTWERQRQMLSETQQRLKDGFERWR